MLHKISKNPYTFDDLIEYELNHPPEEAPSISNIENLAPSDEPKTVPPNEAPSNSNRENSTHSNEQETVLVFCSNCKRVIPDGEIFKHCSISTEDYC